MSHPFSHLSADELARHGQWLRRVALRLVDDEATADDLAQDAWAELARKDEPRGELRPLLGGVLRNLALRRRVRDARRRRRERAAARLESERPSDGDTALDAQEALISALRSLDDELRGVVLARYYDDLSAAEIARRRGVPASTVRAQLRRALARLRERLDRRYDGDRAAWSAALLRLPAKTGGDWIAPLIGITAMNTLPKVAAAATVVALSFVLWRPWDTSTPAPDAVAPGETAREELDPPLADEPAHSPERTSAARAAPPRVVPAPDVSLHVVDVHTGLPARFYAVDLGTGDALETIVTDDRGFATIPSRWFAAPFTLTASDHPDMHLTKPATRRVGDGSRPDSDEELVFEVEVGPSYELVLPDPPPPDGAFALLDTRPFRTEKFEQGLPLREGERPWVRFDPAGLDRRTLGPGPWYLRVRDWQGRWQASAEVETIAGEHPGPVVLEGGAKGMLHVYVRLEDEVPPMSSTVHVLPLEEQGEGRTVFAPARGRNLEGSASLPFLEPGPYRVTVEAEGTSPYSADLEIRAGGSEQLVAELEWSGESHELTVLLESEGEPLDLRFTFVSAVSVDDPELRLSAELPRSSEPQPQARRVFPALPPGRWRIRLGHVAHLPDWHPGIEQEVDATAGEVVFTCLNASGPPMVSPVVVVTDPDGEPISSGAVSIYLEGRKWLGRGFVRGRSELPPIQAGKRCDLAVRAIGYRPAWLEDVVVEEGELEVELAPGWGTVIECRLGPDLRGGPAVGVEVQLDGRRAGITNATGRVRVEADELPERIEFVHPDLALGGGDVTAEGKLTNPDLPWTTSVWMRERE